MEWIEVSARTLDDARELALDRLGVVAEELEYEVIDEPRGGLFGLGRTEARIRARVKPLSREKPADRRRRRTSERRPSGGSRKPRGDSGARVAAGTRPARSRDELAGRHRALRATGLGTLGRRDRAAGAGGRGAGASGDTPKSIRLRSRGNDDRAEAKVNIETDAEDVDIEAQAEQAASFTRSLVEAMGLDRHRERTRR